MAGNTEIALEVKIQTAESARTVKELRTSLKDLINEIDKVPAGSEGFKKLTKSINDTEGKLGDLNDSFNTLTGSGVERTNKSFNLLKEGFTSFDTGKIKAGFAGMGAAMKAIPIFLIVEGIRYLVENFEKLSNGSGILAKVLKPIGELFTWITDKVYEFTDAIGLTNSSLDDMGEKTVENAAKAQEALSAQTAEFDRQMKVAKAAGKSTIDLEIAKQEAIVATNKAIVEQVIAFVRAGGTMSEEQKKLVTESLNKIKDAKAEEVVINANADKTKLDNYKKHLEEKATLEKNANAEFLRRLDLTVQSQIENEERDKKAIEDKKNAEIAAILEINAADNAEDLKTREEKRTRDQQDADAKVQQGINERNTINETLKVAKMSFESQAQLSNFLFDLKRKNLVKGSAEDLKLAKRQFQINKALAIQSSIISGIQGVINALSAQHFVFLPF